MGKKAGGRLPRKREDEEKDKMQSVMEIINAVCFDYGISLEELRSAARYNVLVFARRDVACKLKGILGLSHSSIGRLIGRDHSTIMHYLKIL